MKNCRLLLFSLVISLLSSIQTQAQLNWFFTGESSADCQVHTFLGKSNNGLGLVYTYPTQKWLPSSRQGVIIRYYKESMKEYTHVRLPEDCPQYVSISDFGEYTVVWGNGTEKSAGEGELKIMFLDENGYTVAADHWSLSGENFSWPDNRKVSCLTFDTSYIFFEFWEMLHVVTMTQNSVNYNYRSVAYNRDLERVWESNTTVFSGLRRCENCRTIAIDLVDDTTLLLLRTEMLDGISRLAVYSRKPNDEGRGLVLDALTAPEGSKPYMDPHPERMITPDEELILAGFYGTGVLTYNLYFMKKDLNVQGAPMVKYYPVDSLFSDKPARSDKDFMSLPVGRQVLCLEDGVLMVMEVAPKPLSNCVKDLVLVRFDLDGNLLWKKTIPRNYCSGDPPSDHIRAFDTESGIVLFYADCPANVNTTGPVDCTEKSLSSTASLACAVIDDDGSIIERRVVCNNQNTALPVSIGEIYQLDPGHFIITGIAGGKHGICAYSLW